MVSDLPNDSREMRWDRPDIELIAMMIDVTVALSKLTNAVSSIASTLPDAQKAEVLNSLSSVNERVNDIRKALDPALQEIKQQHG